MKLTKKEIEVIILLAQKIIIALDKEDKEDKKERNIELQNKDYNLVIDDVGQVYNPTKCAPCDD